MCHIVCSMLMCGTSASHWIPGDVLKYHPPISYRDTHIYSQKLKSISGICIWRKCGRSNQILALLVTENSIVNLLPKAINYHIAFYKNKPYSVYFQGTSEKGCGKGTKDNDNYKKAMQNFINPSSYLLGMTFIFFLLQTQHCC